MLSRTVSAIVRACIGAAWPVVLLAVLLGAAAGYYTSNHFAIDTNSEKLVSPDADWRKNVEHYDRAFPQQNNTIVAVVDGQTAELADAAAAALNAALSANRKNFVSVRRPDGGPFFEHEGLLLQPLPSVKKTADALIAAQPFLGGLAADPSLRGVMNTLNTTLLGVTGGQTTLANLDRPITAFSSTLQQIVDGKRAWFGWSSLVAGSDLSRTRRFVEVQPKLNFEALMPGEQATKAIRRTVRRLALDESHGVRVRLTGPVPLSDEEFASITDRGELLAGLMVSAMLIMLWLALRSVRMMIAVLATVAIGLVITTAIGLLIYHQFNVISVAFIVLFVGLGVDFGIQFCVRYRTERFRCHNLHKALPLAGEHIGAGLTLAAIAAALAFYSFLPTNYAGLAQLGAIAGTGMIVTYVMSISVLPALLKLLNPSEEEEDIGFSQLKPLDDLLTHSCNRVIRVAAIVGGIGLLLSPFMHFDSNPLDLRNRHSESVSTAFELMQNRETSPNTINILQPSRVAASQLAARLSKLPEVSQVLTVDTFVPGQQDEKLAILQDAAKVLDTVFNPLFVVPTPSDADVVASLRTTSASLRAAATSSHGAPAAHARALAGTLDRVAAASLITRARAAQALVPGLKTMLGQLRAVLHPAPIRFESLPADLKQDWISKQGEYRVEVFPVADPNDRKGLRHFTRTILAIAPHATGTPIIILESAHTIVWAFVEAGVLSFISISVIILLVLRRFGDELMTLIPLVFAGVMTLATCVLLGIQLNFANIIALPLLFGVGVAFDIYFVMAWRDGRRNLLQSSLTRAILMSAGTTGAAFGTLSISSHPGTASMGLVLLISLFWILVAMLLVLPALLHYSLPHEGLEAQQA
ncbi:MAG: MMPL family transporter [Alphaproteobacteria bacterium]|nr:MMPL family transporter [Alphaproteobacteria bacterium]